jgi:DNA-binding sugar fermentation-stimulating protein
MAQLRGVRLINAVANGTVLGAELETYLQDEGRLAEFTEILSQRGQAQRIANGQTTMDAIVLSLAAKNAIFIQATASNSTAVEAVVKSSIAMGAVAASISALENVSDNPTSWGFFILSAYYEVNILNIVANFAGVNPATHNNISELILDSTSIADVAVDSRAMRAVVASLSTVDIMAGNSVAMTNVADDTAAITVVAETTSIMPTIASHVEAMNEIVSRAIPMNRMSINAGAIRAIAANATAWTNFKSSAFFTADLKEIVANLAGLTPSDYADIDAIFADATASLAVANSATAMSAVLADSTATTSMIGSPHLATILGASAAMTEITSSESTMNTLITDTTAFPILLTSAAAKAAIFASSTLLNTMLTDAGSLATVQGLAQTKVGPTPDTVVGAFQSLGLSGNVILLTGVMGSIVGTLLTNYFKGDTGATDTFACPGVQAIVPPTSINKGYTNVVWDVNSIAATAAAKITVTYVDFN